MRFLAAIICACLLASSAHAEPSLKGYPAPLVAKVAEIKRACPGFRVVSAHRPNSKVRGSGRRSLHADRRAVDINGGSYKCAYALLTRAKWRGSVSTDARRARHIHIGFSPGSREHGSRFAHWRPTRTGVGG